MTEPEWTQPISPQMAVLRNMLAAADRRRQPVAGETATEPYDFRFASKLSPDHMRALQARAEALASALNRTMSLYLNNHAEFAVRLSDVVTYEQYVAELTERPVLGLLTFAAGSGPALWEFSREAAYVAMECMLGGTGGSGDDTGTDAGEAPSQEVREATPLERAVLRRLFQEILSAWTELWGRLKALGPEVADVSAPGGPTEVPAAEERLLCVTLAVMIGQTAGTMRLCLPLSAVKRLLREEKEAVRVGDLERPGEIPVATALIQTPLRVCACLQPPDMTLATLLRMQPGEVLDLRLPASAPFTVSIGDTRKFRGVAGVIGGKVAVRLLDDGQQSQTG